MQHLELLLDSPLSSDASSGRPRGDQRGDLMPPAFADPASVPPFRWTCLKLLPGETARRRLQLSNGPKHQHWVHWMWRTLSWFKASPPLSLCLMAQRTFNSRTAEENPTVMLGITPRHLHPRGVVLAERMRGPDYSHKEKQTHQNHLLPNRSDSSFLTISSCGRHVVTWLSSNSKLNYRQILDLAFHPSSK